MLNGRKVWGLRNERTVSLTWARKLRGIKTFDLLLTTNYGFRHEKPEIIGIRASPSSWLNSVDAAQRVAKVKQSKVEETSRRSKYNIHSAMVLRLFIHSPSESRLLLIFCNAYVRTVHRQASTHIQMYIMPPSQSVITFPASSMHLNHSQRRATVLLFLPTAPISFASTLHRPLLFHASSTSLVLPSILLGCWCQKERMLVQCEERAHTHGQRRRPTSSTTRCDLFLCFWLDTSSVSNWRTAGALCLIYYFAFGWVRHSLATKIP